MNSLVQYTIGCLLSILVCSWMNVCCLEACDIMFEMFPGINDTVVARELTTVNIAFKLKGDTCHSKDSLLITVSLKDDIDCIIRQAMEKCSVLPGITTCTCTEHDGYMFSRSVSRSDQGIWRWILYKGTSKLTMRNINFTIIYPAHVTSLTVNGSDGTDSLVVSRNQTVELFCSWETGNSPSSVRLIDSHGNILTNKFTNESSSMTYNYVFGCHDSGEMKCESDGSGVKRSATVNVRCPPTFLNPLPSLVEAIYGKNTHLSFLIDVSYIVVCRLTKRNTTDMSNTAELPSLSYHCVPFQDPRYSQFVTDALRKTISSAYGLDGNKCWCRVQGTSDKTLSVDISHLTTTDIGLWQLNVSNEFGSAVRYIFLTSSQVHDTDEYKKKHNAVLTASIIAGIVIFAIVSLIVIIICIKRYNRDGDLQPIPVIFQRPSQ